MTEPTPSGSFAVGDRCWAPVDFDRSPDKLRPGVLAALVQPNNLGWTHRVSDTVEVEDCRWSMWLTAAEFDAAQRAGAS